MNEICKNCTDYLDEDAYKGTGYCISQQDYVKEYDSCPDFEEE